MVKPNTFPLYRPDEPPRPPPGRPKSSAAAGSFLHGGLLAVGAGVLLALAGVAAGSLAGIAVLAFRWWVN